MPIGGSGGVYAMKPGDLRAVPFPGTQAGIQQGLDYLSAPGGELFIGPGTYSITGLTVYGKTKIIGAGPQATVLSHSGSSTGIREKTAGEGNGAQGAAGIIIQDLSLRASGSTGDGINLGNQGGPSFTSHASLRNVLVRDFASGTGVKLLANAVMACQDVWSVSNSVGFYLDGGSCFYNGVWAEGNTDTGIRIVSPANTLMHVHLEDLAVGPSSLIEIGGSGDYTTIVGVTIQLGANGIAKLIREMSGAHYCQYFGVRVIAGGFTWTHTIYNETNTKGVGTAPQYIPAAIDGSLSNTVFSYFRDTDSGIYMPVRGSTGFLNIDAGSMASASTITPDGFSSYFSVTGAVTIDNIGTNTAWVGRVIWIETASNPTIKHNSGGTGNIRLTGSADVAMTANDMIAFIYTGSVWKQCSPVVVI
jgi:hypothetical protein